jgi:hypothetical protein
MKQNNKNKDTTIRVRKDIAQRARVKAAIEGIDLGSFIEKLILKNTKEIKI